MKKQTSAQDYLPNDQIITSLRKAAMNCHGCHLYLHAKQTVFGAGSSQANLI